MTCPDGCAMVSRDDLLGRVGVAQCQTCSRVWETTGWGPRVCGHCGKAWGESLHDPCLGQLDGVAQACCGHGAEEKAYRIYAGGRVEGNPPS
jgi:hypothetical protein